MNTEKVPNGSPQLLEKAAPDKSQSKGSWQSMGWWWWIILVVLPPGMAGVWAILQLVLLPSVPDCQSAFWNRNEVSSWLYCAQITAEEQTQDSLQKAIEIATQVPSDHPLRPMSDRLITQWSQQLLNQAETSFQNGNLEQAISVAKQIPATEVVTRQQAEGKIRLWHSIWDKANTIYQDAKDAIQGQQWNQAMHKARELSSVENQYWAQTQYQSLVEQIQPEAEETPPPQEEENLASIPEEVDLEQQEPKAEDIAILNKARSLAKSSRQQDLEAAISQAMELTIDSSLYLEAQKLIDTWQEKVTELEDRQHFQQAIALAKKDNLADLEQAIQHAYLISPSSSMFSQANDYIAQWTRRVLQLQAQSQPDPLLFPQPSEPEMISDVPAR